MFTLTLTSDEIKLLNKMLLAQPDNIDNTSPANTLYAKMDKAIDGKDIRTI